MGDAKKDDLRVSFDSRLKLKFCGSKVTSDAGLLAYREQDEVLSLTEMVSEVLSDSRPGTNKQHGLVPMLRQSIYSRLAGYEDVNDAEHPEYQATREQTLRQSQAVASDTRDQVTQLNQASEKRNEIIVNVLVQVTGETLDTFPKS